jgi:hypothetical protein
VSLTQEVTFATGDNDVGGQFTARVNDTVDALGVEKSSQIF